MFFGATSSASSGLSCWRRIRLRSAMATARLAACCPTTCLSSSATIWRGVRAAGAAASEVRASGRMMAMNLQLLDGDVSVRVDADIARDAHGLLDDGARLERAVMHERAGRGHGVGPARPDAEHPVVWLDEVA